MVDFFHNGLRQTTPFIGEQMEDPGLSTSQSGTSFGRGVGRGVAGVSATSKAYIAAALDKAGFRKSAQSVFDSAMTDWQDMQQIGTQDIQDFADIDNAGKAINYAMGAAGQGLASTLPAFVGTGLGALATRTGTGAFLGGMSGMLPQEGGETVLSAKNDPNLSHMQLGELFGPATAKGMVNAAMEEAVPFMTVNRMLKPGTGGNILSRIGQATAMGAAGEGLTEGVQQTVGQAALGNLYEDQGFTRDTSGDLHEAINAGLMGAVGGGIMGAGGQTIGEVARLPLAAANQTGQAASKAANKLSVPSLDDTLSYIRKIKDDPEGFGQDVSNMSLQAWDKAVEGGEFLRTKMGEGADKLEQLSRDFDERLKFAILNSDKITTPENKIMLLEMKAAGKDAVVGTWEKLRDIMGAEGLEDAFVKASGAAGQTLAERKNTLIDMANNGGNWAGDFWKGLQSGGSAPKKSVLGLSNNEKFILTKIRTLPELKHVNDWAEREGVASRNAFVKLLSQWQDGKMAADDLNTFVEVMKHVGLNPRAINDVLNSHMEKRPEGGLSGVEGYITPMSLKDSWDPEGFADNEFSRATVAGREMDDAPDAVEAYSGEIDLEKADFNTGKLKSLERTSKEDPDFSPEIIQRFFQREEFKDKKQNSVPFLFKATDKDGNTVDPSVLFKVFQARFEEIDRSAGQNAQGHWNKRVPVLKPFEKMDIKGDSARFHLNPMSMVNEAVDSKNKDKIRDFLPPRADGEPNDIRKLNVFNSVLASLYDKGFDVEVDGQKLHVEVAVDPDFQFATSKKSGGVDVEIDRKRGQPATTYVSAARKRASTGIDVNSAERRLAALKEYSKFAKERGERDAFVKLIDDVEDTQSLNKFYATSFLNEVLDKAVESLPKHKVTGKEYNYYRDVLINARKELAKGGPESVMSYLERQQAKEWEGAKDQLINELGKLARNEENDEQTQAYIATAINLAKADQVDDVFGLLSGGQLGNNIYKELTRVKSWKQRKAEEDGKIAFEEEAADFTPFGAATRIKSTLGNGYIDEFSREDFKKTLALDLVGLMPLNMEKEFASYLTFQSNVLARGIATAASKRIIKAFNENTQDMRTEDKLELVTSAIAYYNDPRYAEGQAYKEFKEENFYNSESLYGRQKERLRDLKAQHGNLAPEDKSGRSRLESLAKKLKREMEKTYKDDFVITREQIRLSSMLDTLERMEFDLKVRLNTDIGTGQNKFQRNDYLAKGTDEWHGKGEPEPLDAADQKMNSDRKKGKFKNADYLSKLSPTHRTLMENYDALRDTPWLVINPHFDQYGADYQADEALGVLVKGAYKTKAEALEKAEETYRDYADQLGAATSDASMEAPTGNAVVNLMAEARKAKRGRRQPQGMSKPDIKLDKSTHTPEPVQGEFDFPTEDVQAIRDEAANAAAGRAKARAAREELISEGYMPTEVDGSVSSENALEQQLSTVRNPSATKGGRRTLTKPDKTNSVVRTPKSTAFVKPEPEVAKQDKYSEKLPEGFQAEDKPLDLVTRTKKDKESKKAEPFWVGLDEVGGLTTRDIDAAAFKWVQAQLAKGKDPETVYKQMHKILEDHWEAQPKEKPTRSVVKKSEQTGGLKDQPTAFDKAAYISNQEKRALTLRLTLMTEMMKQEGKTDYFTSAASKFEDVDVGLAAYKYADDSGKVSKANWDKAVEEVVSWHAKEYKLDKQLVRDFYEALELLKFYRKKLGDFIYDNYDELSKDPRTLSVYIKKLRREASAAEKGSMAQIAATLEADMLENTSGWRKTQIEGKERRLAEWKAKAAEQPSNKGYAKVVEQIEFEIDALRENKPFGMFFKAAGWNQYTARSSFRVLPDESILPGKGYEQFKAQREALVKKSQEAAGSQEESEQESQQISDSLIEASYEVLNTRQKEIVDSVQRIFGKRVAVVFSDAMESGVTGTYAAVKGLGDIDEGYKNWRKSDALRDIREKRREIIPLLKGKKGAQVPKWLSDSGMNPVEMLNHLNTTEGRVMNDDKALGVITLAANFDQIATVADHEMLHAAFDMFFTPEERRILVKAFTDGTIKNKIKEHFKDEPAVLKAIEQDEEEAVAYGFQLYIADPDFLKPGPATKNLFDKLINWLKSAFELLTAQEKATLILRDLVSGNRSFTEHSPIAPLLERDMSTKQKALKYGKGVAGALWGFFEAAFENQYNRIDGTDNPALQQIARLLYKPTGSTGDNGFIQNWETRGREFMNEVDKILDKYDEATLNKIHKAMRLMEDRSSITEPAVKEAVSALDAYLAKMYKYQEEAGIEQGNLGDKYFPLIWDPEKVLKNRGEFVRMLEKPEYAAIMKTLNKTPHEIADSITHELIRGEEFTSILGRDDEPVAQSSKKRTLGFIKPEDRLPFTNDSLHGTMQLYTLQASRRAEFTRKFGANGVKLKELKSKAEHTYGATPNEMEMTQDLVDGLLGNREIGMSRELRDAMGTIMVYENWRLLPLNLFSSLVDPLGVAVRSGSLTDAWKTFTHSVKNIRRDFRNVTDDEKEFITALTEDWGIIQRDGTEASVHHMYESLALRGWNAKANDTLFKWNLVNGFAKSNKEGAVVACRAYMKRLKEGKIFKEEHNQRYLDELGLTKDDIHLGEDGQVILRAEDFKKAGVANPEQAETKMKNATVTFVQQSILNPNAAEKPGWGSNPYFSLIFQLKSFVFAFQQNIVGRVINEGKHGNFKPAAIALVYVPGVVAADFIKGFVAGWGDEPPWKEDWTFADYMVYGWQRSGLTGVGAFFDDMHDDMMRGGRGYESFLGPAAGHAGDAGRVLFGEGDASRFLIKSLPGAPLIQYSPFVDTSGIGSTHPAEGANLTSTAVGVLDDLPFILKK